jgi:hypothetical protein
MVWDGIEGNSLSSVPSPLLLSYVRFFALSVIETHPENIALLAE